MSNEQLLLEIGRIMGTAIRESEERMKVYVHDVVQASEERVNQKIVALDVKMSAAIEELQEKVGVLDRKVDVLQDKVESLEQKVEILQFEVAALKQRVETLEQKVDVLKDEVVALKQKVEVLDRKVEVLQDKVQRGFDDSERMALQIAATVERLEKYEATA